MNQASTGLCSCWKCSQQSQGGKKASTSARFDLKIDKLRGTALWGKSVFVVMSSESQEWDALLACTMP
jgi:hypothetical protein